MPLTQVIQTQLSRLYPLNTVTGAKIGNGQPTNQQYVARSRDFPATVQRAKPKDQFLNGTSRVSTTILRTDSGFDWVDGTNYHENEVIQSTYPLKSPGSRVNSDGSILDDPVTSVSRSSMYNTIRSNLRGEAVNLGNALGEYRQTAELFLELSKVVHSRGMSLLKRHKAGRQRGQIDSASTISSINLQFNYGIKPLAQDMGTAVAELKAAITVKPPFVEGHLRRRDLQTNVGFIKPSSSLISRWASSTVSVETTLRTTWRAYFHTPSLTTVLADHGMLNPASLAWELMPYSFVIDWWVNVGDILSSLDNLLLYQSLMVIDSTSTKRRELAATRPNSAVLTNGIAFRMDRTDSRQAPQSISLVATPQYKPSLSKQHIANGLSLLHQALGR